MWLTLCKYLCILCICMPTWVCACVCVWVAVDMGQCGVMHKISWTILVRCSIRKRYKN